MISPERKGIGLNLAQANAHHIDHLGIICILMQIPLLVTDRFVLRIIERLYPGLQILFEDVTTVTPDYLASHYDVFFQSDLCHRNDFHLKFEPLEKKYGKIIRNVHCPHGYSDKSFYLEKSVFEDILLIYGDAMLDMFKSRGVYSDLCSYVRTGNYRLQYYNQHKTYLDEIAENQVFSRFHKQLPLLLYAPTWNDEEQSSSFFLAAETLIENLPREYNLLIKLHPLLEENDITGLYRMMGKYENKGNVVFLKDFPLIYPLLAKTEAYIGDMSSIGYDFLAFNRPLFFLNHQKKNSFLHKCGILIQPDEYQQIFQTIAKELEGDDLNRQEVRRQVYHYTFGDEVPFEVIRREIIKQYDKKRH